MRVRQIVRNLVANAIVHGGEHIRVATTRIAQQARLIVADDGPGLAPGDEERVFEPFQHGNREARGHNSVGLGLTISRQLARLMGGDLTYSREQGLTVFRLVLPGRPPPSAAAWRRPGRTPRRPSGSAPGCCGPRQSHGIEIGFQRGPLFRVGDGRSRPASPFQPGFPLLRISRQGGGRARASQA